MYLWDIWTYHYFFYLSYSFFSFPLPFLSYSSFFSPPCCCWFAYYNDNLIAKAYNYSYVCYLSPCPCWPCACWAGWFCAGCGILYCKLILIASANSGSSTYMPPMLPPPPLMKMSVPNNFSLKYTSPGYMKILWLLSSWFTVWMNVSTLFLCSSLQSPKHIKSTAIPFFFSFLANIFKVSTSSTIVDAIKHTILCFWV